jgi:hypothetical protein
MMIRSCARAWGFASLVFTSLIPAPGGAQIADTWLHATPIEARGGWRSTRLLAMGDLQLAAAEGFDRLNPFDYGNNPAGLLGARDTSWVEQSSEYQDFENSYYGQFNSAVLRRSGARGAVRGGGVWALGVEVAVASVSASRHEECPTPDQCRFIRDFDIPLAGSSQPVLGDRTLGAGVRYPSVALSYARRMRSWLTLGLRYGYRDESEDRHLADPYDLDAGAVANEYTGGAVIRVPGTAGKVQLSGYGQFIQNTVTAESQSAFNDDEYDWYRPQVGYGAQLVVHAGMVRGVADGRHRSYDGEQVARVNWAPQFFLNPLPSETGEEFVFRRRWSSFLSGLRHNEASTRWILRLPGSPLHVGLDYAVYRQFQWIRPNPNVLQMALPLDVRRLGYRAGSGISLELPDGEGAVGAEVRMARDFRADLSNGLPDIATSTLTYHFGAEYKVIASVPLRAGVVLVRYDPDRRDGLPPNKGVRLSGGAGFYWDALGSQIEATMAHEHFRNAPLDPSDELGFGDHLILSITRLF